MAGYVSLMKSLAVLADEMTVPFLVVTSSSPDGSSTTSFPLYESAVRLLDGRNYRARSRDDFVVVTAFTVCLNVLKLCAGNDRVERGDRVRIAEVVGRGGNRDGIVGWVIEGLVEGEMEVRREMEERVGDISKTEADKKSR